MNAAETALQVLVDVCRRCELERQDDRPTEEEYQAALVGAEELLVRLQATDRKQSQTVESVAAAMRFACSEALIGATESPSRGQWDDGFREGVKAVVTVVTAALARPEWAGRNAG